MIFEVGKSEVHTKYLSSPREGPILSGRPGGGGSFQVAKSEVHIKVLISGLVVRWISGEHVG